METRRWRRARPASECVTCHQGDYFLRHPLNLGVASKRLEGDEARPRILRYDARYASTAEKDGPSAVAGAGTRLDRPADLAQPALCALPRTRRNPQTACSGSLAPRGRRRLGVAWCGAVPNDGRDGARAAGAALVFGVSRTERTLVRRTRGQARGLDATNPIAVWTAKRWFNLPYRLARIEAGQELGGAIASGRADYRFSSELAQGSFGKARFSARYRPTSEVYAAGVGTEERSLTERYCFYAMAASRRLYRTEVQHLPWPLQHATAEIDARDLLASHRINLPGAPELLHFCKRIDVLTWAPEAIGNAS